MNELSSRDRALVGIGAALGSNCIPCVEHHIPLARSAGLSDNEIGAALNLADSIRQVPARRTLARATELVSVVATQATPAPGCSTLDKNPVDQTRDAMASTMQRMMASCGGAGAGVQVDSGPSPTPKSSSGCC